MLLTQVSQSDKLKLSHVCNFKYNIQFQILQFQILKFNILKFQILLFQILLFKYYNFKYNIYNLLVVRIGQTQEGKFQFKKLFTEF